MSGSWSSKLDGGEILPLPYDFFFAIWVFFHIHWRTIELQGKREGISLTPHYQFHPLQGHLNISRAITA